MIYDLNHWFKSMNPGWYGKNVTKTNFKQNLLLSSLQGHFNIQVRITDLDEIKKLTIKLRVVTGIREYILL